MPSLLDCGHIHNGNAMITATVGKCNISNNDETLINVDLAIEMYNDSSTEITRKIDQNAVNYTNYSINGADKMFIIISRHSMVINTTLELLKHVVASSRKYCHIRQRILSNLNIDVKTNVDNIHCNHKDDINVCFQLKHLTGDDFACNSPSNLRKENSGSGDIEKNCNNNGCNCIWYFKASNTKNEWKRFDNRLQKEIEKMYQNVTAKNDCNFDYTFDSGTNHYKIYLNRDTNNHINDQLKQEYLTKNGYKKNIHRLLSYDLWNESFTEYFYQQNLETNNYRIVKRVDQRKKDGYTVHLQKPMIDDYFSNVVAHYRCKM